MSGDVHQPSSRGLYAQYKGSHKATFDLTAHMFALVWCLMWFCLIIWVRPWPLPCLGVTTRLTADIFRQRGFLLTITFHHYSGGPYPKYHSFTTLKPKTSTKRPPNRCVWMSPLLKGKLCAIFDAFDFREVCQRMAARRARRAARQVKGQKTTEFHWLRPGASKVSSLGACIRTKIPWSSWRVWACHRNSKRWI